MQLFRPLRFTYIRKRSHNLRIMIENCHIHGMSNKGYVRKIMSVEEM